MYIFMRKLGIGHENACDILKRIYNNPDYHGSYHIEKLWNLFEINRSKLGMSEKESLIIGAILIFHDVIYDVSKSNNEEQSALVFSEMMESAEDSPLSEKDIVEIVNALCLTDPMRYSEVKEGSFADRFIREYDIRSLILGTIDLEENQERLYREAKEKDPSITFEIFAEKSLEFIKDNILPYFPIEKGIEKIDLIYKIRLREGE